MKCSEVIKTLHEYVKNCDSGEINPEYRHHFQNCPSCSNQLASLRAMLALMKDLPSPSLTDEQWRSMHQEILKKLPVKEIKSQKILKVKTTAILPMRAAAAVLLISFISLAAYFGFQFKNRDQVSAIQNADYPRISKISGPVYSKNIYENDSEQQLSTTSSIGSGKMLRTTENSSLNFQVDEISSIDLNKSTSLEVVACTKNVQVFKLEKGDIQAHVGKTGFGRIFRIETPNATCEIVGTRFSVSVQQSPDSLQVTSVLSVYEGRVKFNAGNGKVVFVDSGKFVTAINDSCGSPLSFEFKDKPVAKNGACSFEIITEPASALVEIDGKYTGVTPFKGYASSGVHGISLAKNGFTTWSGKINLNKNICKRLQITLENEFNTNSSFDQVKLPYISALIESGKIDSALFMLRKIYLNNSFSPHLRAAALKKAAMCYKMSGKVHEAVAALESIVKGPFTSECKESALFQMASLRSSELSDYKGAIKDLQKYIKEYPEGVWAEEVLFNLAEMLYLQKDYSGAVSAYRRIIADFQGSSRLNDALYSLARIFSRDLDDCESALGLFGRLEKDFPKSSFAEDAVFWKADCLLHMGHASQAIEEYGRYIAKYPEGKWAAEARARIRKTDLSGVN